MQIRLPPVSPVDHNFTPSGGPRVSHTFSLITVTVSGFLAWGTERSVPPLRLRKVKKMTGGAEKNTLHIHHINISRVEAPLWVFTLTGRNAQTFYDWWFYGGKWALCNFQLPVVTGVCKQLQNAHETQSLGRSVTQRMSSAQWRMAQQSRQGDFNDAVSNPAWAFKGKQMFMHHCIINGFDFEKYLGTWPN